MKISLYVNHSDAKEVNKSISLLISYDSYFLESSSIQNPIVRLEASQDVINRCNYIYIAEFKRYYYVTDVTVDNTNLYTLTLRCDVLMSFKDAIYNQTALISRQEFYYNKMLYDSEIKQNTKPYIITKKFSGGFTNTYTYVLVLAGGYGS